MSPASHAGCVELMVDRHVRHGGGERIALLEVAPDGQAMRRRALRYRSLMMRTIEIASSLPAVDAQPEPMRIALIGSATLETVCHWLGAMRAGHLVFLVHPDLGEEQYDVLMRTYRPHLVWRDRTARVPLGELLPEIRTDENGDGDGCDGEDNRIDAYAAPASHAANGSGQPGSEPLATLAESRFFDDVRPALVLSSSGSTGNPKLCVHSHRAFWHFERDVSRPMWNLDASDRVLASGGPYFSFGLQGIHPPLSVGATAVLLPEWKEHADFLRTIAAERVTVFLAVPTLFHLLHARTEPGQLAADTASLRICLSAGERLPDVVRQRWETHANVPLCDSIGTTETFAPYLSEIVGQGRGLRAVQGFDYEMRRTDLADPRGATVFMASVRSRCTMLGAIEEGRIVPVARRFATNDLFTLDGSRWNFVSRRSERVKVSGCWVSPQELEEFLLQDPCVLKAAAVPIETPEGLQRLRAFVVLKPEAGSSDEAVRRLQRQARLQLRPKALCPDMVCAVPDLSSTPTGKLKRLEVRAKLIEMQLGQAEFEELAEAEEQELPG
jgi:acyl-coenzyme A synthetase/AMP-(fatty) acid ligase